MPTDTKDETKAPAMVGRTYRGEAAPITTPEAVAERQDRAKVFAAKKGAMPIAAYFATKGIDNPILHASMLAYTDIRVATVEDFDEIFDDHHTTPQQREADKAAAEKAAAEKKAAETVENPSH